jgi:hypothetical protein
MNRFSLSVAVALFCTALSTPAATINASDSGWYDQDGVHNPAFTTYFTGAIGGLELRSFYVFDLTGLSPGSITGGTLTLSNRDSDVGGTPLPGTVGSPMTLNLFDVSSLLADVVGGLNGLAVFADLGTGNLLGSLAVANDNPGNVVITLNAAGLTFLNSQAGGTVVIGLALAAPGQADRYIFSNEGSPADFTDSIRRLDLTTLAPPDQGVPEPSTSALMLGAMAGLMAWRKSRQA